MRALAEFAMRGRPQAIAVAVLGLVVPFFVWVSVAVVALVTLRRSGVDALIVFGWTALAALGLLLMQRDPGPLTALIGIAAAAFVLRWTRSWPLALAAIVAAAFVTGVAVAALGSEPVAALTAQLNDLIGKLRTRMPAEQADLLSDFSPVMVSGLLALRCASLAVIGLLLGRWWQASLYNPGGFREEFHSLRLPLPLAAALIGAGLLMLLPGEDYRWWAALCAVPFVVAGFALIHGVAGLKGWGRAPLVVLYVAWFVLLEGVTAALLLLALIDSWWDFRGRLRARSER